MLAFLWECRKDKELLALTFRAFFNPVFYLRPLKGRPGYRFLWFVNIISMCCYCLGIAELVAGEWNGLIQIALGIWNMLLFMDGFFLYVAILLRDKTTKREGETPKTGNA
jgi:hypothetical protein